MTAGNIDKLELDITTLGLSTLQNLQIRLKETPLTNITSDNYEKDGLISVYHYNTTISGTGTHTFNFTTPFMWDGVSNIIVDFSFTNDTNGTDFVLNGEATPFSSAVFATQDDKYFDFDRNYHSYIDLQTNHLFPQIDSSVTVSFWTDTDIKNITNYDLPPFSVVDNSNIFQMLVRMPTTQPRIRWWSGRELGAGLDNIGHSENLTDYSDLNQGWTHWAFTRSPSSVMNVYRNGQVYFNAVTGNTERILDRLYKFRIGADRDSDNDFYEGKMNEFQIWNTALEQTTIQDWMYKDLDESHPSYENLVGYFKFDGDNNQTAIDETGTSKTYVAGLPVQGYVAGHNRFRNLSDATERPNITFIQGEYVSYLDSTLVTYSIENPTKSVIVSVSFQDLSMEGMQDIPFDTLHVWEPGYSYTYDGYGNILDSTYYATDQTYYNWYTGEQMLLAGFTTPYGNYLSLGDGFSWTVDLTEYAPLLKGTIDLECINRQEVLDLKFLFITGTPPQDVIQMTNLPKVGGTYADIVANPQNYQNPVVPDVNATRFAIRGVTSGHGWNNAPNCSEFCQRTHFIEVDGIREYDWIPWKECATNPVYPQGGTWIYDRTGWCPGSFKDVQHFDLTDIVTPGEESTIRRGVDPDPSGTEFGNWSGSFFLMGYSTPNFVNDATVYDIITPSTKDEYLRFNPICSNAIIEIRNNGSATMTSAEIEYGVEGGMLQTYAWTGSLEFLEVATVALPMHAFSEWWALPETTHQFVARIASVNGGQDEHAENDWNSSTFETPPSHISELTLRLRTNNYGWQTSWNLQDSDGNTLYSGNSLFNNTTYDVEFELEPGCYTLNVNDSGDDGLEFWANPAQGEGFCQLRVTPTNGLLKTFEPDFGDNIRYEFSVAGLLSNIDTDVRAKKIKVYPNPSLGLYHLAFENFPNYSADISVYDVLGKKVYSDQLSIGRKDHFVTSMELGFLASGVYFIKVSSGEFIWSERLVKR